MTCSSRLQATCRLSSCCSLITSLRYECVQRVNDVKLPVALPAGIGHFWPFGLPLQGLLVLCWQTVLPRDSSLYALSTKV